MYQNICYRCFKNRGDYEVCPHCGYIEGTKPEQDYYLLPGTILAERYVIGVKIGTGGFGIIYKAYDLKDKQIVAIKEFYPSRMVNRMPGESTINIFTGSQMDEYQNLRSQFETEARYMEHFRQEPDIVNLKEYLEENGTAYIVMEYIDGILLRDFLKMNGKMSEADAVQIAVILLKTLKKIHEKGIVHRDISPDNIFLLENNGIKIFDFGSADRITGKKEKKMKKSSTLVKPGYTPPEQYGLQCANTPAMDIYAVGATVYEMLTGKRPVEGSARAIHDELQSPLLCGADISENTDRIIMRAIAVKPEMRFASAKEFEEVLVNKKKVERPETEWKKRQHKKKLITGIAASMSVICMAAVIWFVAYLSMNNLTDVNIKEDTLTLWVPSDENLDGMTDIWVTEYQKVYPQINLQVERIPKEEYPEKLEEARRAGELPDVFCTRDYRGDAEKDCASLKPLIRSLDTEKCLFYENYEDYYPDMLELPVGFQIGVLYENSMRMQNSETAVEVTALNAETADTLAWADGQDMEGVYKDFAKEKTPLNAIAGDLSILKNVEGQTIEKVPAKDYGVIPMTHAGKLLGVFTDTWAVNRESEKNRRNAGMLLLSYLIEEVLQEEAYLASYDSIPVNKEAYEKYKEYKMTAKLSFLEDYEGKMKISSQADNIWEAYQDLIKEK